MALASPFDLYGMGDLSNVQLPPDSQSSDNSPAYQPPTDVSDQAGFGFRYGRMNDVSGLVLHHTGDNHSLEQGIDDARNSGLGAQYRMARDGTVSQLAPDGAVMQHIRPGRGPAAGLGNHNMQGLEVAAKNDDDITPAQRSAIPQFVAWHASKYGYNPTTGVFGHSEINPGHRTNEMGDIATSIREGTSLPRSMALGGEPGSQPTPTPSPSPRGAPTPEDSSTPPPMGMADRLTRSPAFMAGLGILGAPPGVLGGNWGAGAISGASEANRATIAQEEHENTMAQRAQRQRIWRQAFPGGQPNPQHPLVQGVPPEVLQAAAAGGADEGLPLLQKYALASGEQKLLLQMQMRRAGVAYQSMFGKLPPGMEDGAPPGGAPQQAAGAPSGASSPPAMLPPATPASLPGIGVGSAIPLQPPQPPQPPQPQQPQIGAPAVTGTSITPGQSVLSAPVPETPPTTDLPYGAAGPAASERMAEAARAQVMHSPTVQAQYWAHLAAGDKAAADKFLQAQITQATAPIYKGLEKYNEVRGQEQAELVEQKRRTDVADMKMEQLEERAKAMLKNDPKTFKASIGPVVGGPTMGDYPATRKMILGTKAYEWNLEMRHILEGVSFELKSSSGKGLRLTDQAQRGFDSAVGMALQTKSPEKFFQILHDARDFVRASGGYLPQNHLDRYLPGEKEVPDKKQPPPAPGARLAKDGSWYVPDQQRPGKYMQWRP